MNKVNFFSISDNEKYNMFVLPFIVSTLYTVKNSFCEILIKDHKRYIDNNKDAINILDKYFKNRYLIRETPNYNNLNGVVSRFLDIPNVKLKYTYIVDIDILVTDKNIVQTHKKLMEEQNIPYSNIVYDVPLQMSGCIFMDTFKYYSKVERSILKFKNNPRSIHFPIYNDNRLLYLLIKDANIGLPKYTTFKYRPLPGIHTSVNRKYPLGNEKLGELGWAINTENYLAYEKFRNSDIFNEFYKYFDKQYIENVINKLDTIDKIDIS